MAKRKKPIPRTMTVLIPMVVERHADRAEMWTSEEIITSRDRPPNKRERAGIAKKLVKDAMEPGYITREHPVAAHVVWVEVKVPVPALPKPAEKRVKGKIVK